MVYHYGRPPKNFLEGSAVDFRPRVLRITKGKLKMNCVICNKTYKWNLFWELEKFLLRTTEVSLLWENCCSEKCYRELLERLISGKYKLGHDENKRVN